MSSVYHVDKRGEPALCRASKRPCPLGGAHGTLEELEAHLARAYAPGGLSKNVSYAHLFSDHIPSHYGDDEREFWQQIKSNLGIRVFGKRLFARGDESESAYFCYECYGRLPKHPAHGNSSWSQLCPHCGGRCVEGLVGVTLQPAHEKFFDKSQVYSHDWYHFSSDDSWESYLEPGNADARLIHLGSLQAATERQKHTRGRAGRLYQLRVNSDAVICDDVLEEDPHSNRESPLANIDGYVRGVYVPGITRYVNYYEDPGSVSLIANPRTVTLVNSIELPALEA